MKRGMMNKSKLAFKKEWADFCHQVEQDLQPDYCLLCGKKMTSPCNSHVVPQFILKRIADKGMVCYGQSLFQNAWKNDFIKTTTGINNAFTFRLICNDCDKKQFCHYETPAAILNYDSFSLEEQKLILLEMAIKTHLSHIYTKAKTYTEKAMQCPELMDSIHACVGSTAYELDIQEHKKYIQTLNRFKKTTSFPFVVLYDRLLDYETDIAAQTIISYTHNLKGEQLYDPYDFSQDELMQYLYLMILPYQGKTRVLFYVEKKYQSHVQSIIEGFNTLTEADKLHFLFVSLIIYDEHFYICPSLQEKMKKDRKIIKLYTRTDHSGNGGVSGMDEIANFRRYHNYLTDDK